MAQGKQYLASYSNSPKTDVGFEAYLTIMISRQIQSLIQRSKTTTHLLQLQSLVFKTALDHDTEIVSRFVLSACSISVDFARLVFDSVPITPPLFAWNTIIRTFTKSSASIESVRLFSQLQRVELKPDNFTYPFVLKACGQCSMYGEGGAVHSMIIKEGFDSDRYIGNTLLRMYAACGAIRLARRVFDEMPVRDVVSWSSMIAGYVAWYVLSCFNLYAPIQFPYVAKPFFN